MFLEVFNGYQFVYVVDMELFQIVGFFKVGKKIVIFGLLCNMFSVYFIVDIVYCIENRIF